MSPPWPCRILYLRTMESGWQLSWNRVLPRRPPHGVRNRRRSEAMFLDSVPGSPFASQGPPPQANGASRSGRLQTQKQDFLGTGEATCLLSSRSRAINFALFTVITFTTAPVAILANRTASYRRLVPCELITYTFCASPCFSARVAPAHALIPEKEAPVCQRPSDQPYSSRFNGYNIK